MALTTSDGPGNNPARRGTHLEITGAVVKIKLLQTITGTRDGVSWPAPGETMDLPDHEAAKLCASGMAEPVNTRGKSEKATAPAAETRAAKKSTARKA